MDELNRNGQRKVIWVTCTFPIVNIVCILVLDGDCKSKEGGPVPAILIAPVSGYF